MSQFLDFCTFISLSDSTVNEFQMWIELSNKSYLIKVLLYFLEVFYVVTQHSRALCTLHPGSSTDMWHWVIETHDDMTDTHIDIDNVWDWTLFELNINSQGTFWFAFDFDFIFGYHQFSSCWRKDLIFQRQQQGSRRRGRSRHRRLTGRNYSNTQNPTCLVKI